MTSANAPGLFREGAVIAGKYRVERVVASGGMGIVVAARHMVLGERVALKFLHPEALANMEAIGRFIREAQAATRIKSEHVTRVTDVGQLEDGAPFIVMEYLDGADLSTCLIKNGALGIPQAVDFVLQACEAIAEAHMRGIVHRDLKPSNLFCVTKPDGALSIKVLDFGISKVTTPDAAQHKLTRADSVLGSPVYMSPEQMTRSRAVDERTDIWSLGVILFELVTGKIPFDAETVPELAIKVATEPPRLLGAFIRDVPPGLERVIARCLEKDRDKRFANVGEMAEALQELGTVSARQSTQAILGTLARTDRSLPGIPMSAASSDDRLVQLHPSGAIRTDLSWGALTSGSRSRRAALAGIAAAIGLTGLVVGVGVSTEMRAPASPGSKTAGASSLWSAAPVPSASAAPPAVAPPVAPSAAASPPRPLPSGARPGAATSSRAPVRATSTPPKIDDDRLGL